MVIVEPGNGGAYGPFLEIRSDTTEMDVYLNFYGKFPYCHLLT